MDKKNRVGIRMKFTLFFLVLGIFLSAGLSQMTYYVVRYQKVGPEDYSNEGAIPRFIHNAASVLISTQGDTYGESLLNMLDTTAYSVTNASEHLRTYGQVIQEESDKKVAAADAKTAEAENAAETARKEAAAAKEEAEAAKAEAAARSESSIGSVPLLKSVLYTPSSSGDEGMAEAYEDEEAVGYDGSGDLSEETDDTENLAEVIDASQYLYSYDDYCANLETIDSDFMIQLLEYIGKEFLHVCETYQLDAIYIMDVSSLTEEKTIAAEDDQQAEEAGEEDSRTPTEEETGEEDSQQSEEDLSQTDQTVLPYYLCSVVMNGSEPAFDVLAFTDETDFYSDGENDEFAGIRKVIWETQKRTESLDITKNAEGEKIATVYIPIANGETDQIVFVIGADIRMDDILQQVRNQVLPMAVVIILSVLLLMILLILFVNKVVLLPIRDLNRGVGRMRDGEWKTSVKVHSNDELGEIAEMFNDMSHNIGTHIENMEALNAAYSRFLPEKMIQLQKEDSIINIHEGDYRSVPGMTIMSMQIDDISRRSSQMSPEELFRFLNQVSSISIPVVTAEEDHEQGIVERMENGGLEVYYEKSTEQALKDALEICRASVQGDGSGKLDLSIAITRGKILLGVVGQEDRMEFVAFSEEKKLASHLQEIADSYYANILISESAANTIPDFRNRYHSRLVGYVDVTDKISEDGTVITRKEAIYDVFDSDPEEQKQLKQYTAEIFEQGVLEYTAGEYEKASRHFLEVLRWNINDKAARQYI